MSEDYKKKLKSLLRRLFQFESSDLDFGIYRIMNYKRGEIDNFIEKDLVQAIETAFDKYIQSDAAILRKELKEIEEKIRKDLGQYAIDDNGNINDLYKQSNIAKEYEEKKKALEAQDISLQKKAEIFSHIYEFFSRYYDNGDFLSKRRYSQKNKYVIPYNGEEVLLHWTTKDQYYIKTDEHFRNYSFDTGSYKVEFLISDVEAEENNNKAGKRFFLLKKDESFAIDDTNKIFKIFFVYRELNDEEIKIYGARNIQDSILEETTERILKYLGDSPLKTTLTKVKKDKPLLQTHLYKYTKRNTSNYFIHKNLKNFLQQELDFYLKNEVMDLDDLLTKSEKELKLTIAQNNVIKEISNKIIDFVAQIEDFQKALFLKKKFVLKTEYCMTLDKVPEEL